MLLVARLLRHCAVALVEQQVQHSQHAPGALRQKVDRWHPVGDAGVVDLLLGPHQSLGHGRFRNQERPGDLRHGQTGERPRRQGDPRRHPGCRMAAGVDEPQPIVGDVVRRGLHRGFRSGQSGQLALLRGTDGAAASTIRPGCGRPWSATRRAAVEFIDRPTG